MLKPTLISALTLLFVARALRADAPAPAAPPATNPNTVATIGGVPISRDELTDRLFQYYGLTLLAQQMQLTMAREDARTQNVLVTPQDVADELPKSIAMLVPNQPNVSPEDVIPQILTAMNVTRPAFDVWVQTNAYMRKILAPTVQTAITDDLMRQTFDMIYGERVIVEHIQLNNMTEIAAAERRLAAGESFESIATDMSRDTNSAPAGGELPPFTMKSLQPSEEFRKAAFALKNPGDISEPVQSGDSFHLIKLKKHFPAQQVTFNDPLVQNNVRTLLTQGLMASGMRDLRNKYRAADFVITDPVLKKQYQQERDDFEAKMRDKAALLDQERKDLAATSPSTAPATNRVIDIPSIDEGALRPPATLPGQ